MLCGMYTNAGPDDSLFKIKTASWQNIKVTVKEGSFLGHSDSSFNCLRHLHAEISAHLQVRCDMDLIKLDAWTLYDNTY